ncbi:neocarzinostatin apoprotein domain-containing protein [Nocardia transvalensis]|uniref:neocarzinostatin apoprotein domain-containing protein n=1 Tax=Nocardia transvalensis TaxID=37333 RepID=UPI001896035A|nr:neocarzinostatin apoprotein domain-containing protein [Nocardia transvalensis]MBF6331175.1 hypothetical protein [Nocardia transvalensis]
MRRTIARTVLGWAGAIALVTAAPLAAAAPTLHPSTTDAVSVGQVITVTLDGLPPNLAQVAVGQCKPRIMAPGDCNLTGSVLGNADAQGVWRSMSGNNTVTLVASVGGVDCTAASGACTLAVTSLTNPGNILTSVPLTFAKADAVTKAPEVEASSSSDDSGNTALVIGIVVAALVVIGVIVAWLVRRRGGTR